MKKITLVFAVLAVMFASNVNAQENVETKKQVSGNSSLELNFDPAQIFGSSTGQGQFSLKDGQIRYRKFTTDLSAWRLGANFSFGVRNDITQQEDKDNGTKELRDKSSYFSISLKPGYEKHFVGTKSLSPYVGVEGLIGYSSWSSNHEYQDWMDDSVYDTERSNGSFVMGAGVLAGVDYYFVKNLYLGLEIGYGLTYVNKLNSKYTDEGNSDNDYDRKNGYTVGFNPSVSSTLRLGWTF